MAASNFNRIVSMNLSVSFQGWEKSVGDMFDAIVVGVANDCNDVELCFVGNIVSADIDISGTAYTLDFFCVDGVEGINDIVFAGFDFHEYDVLAFHCHDVDFIMAGAPIPFDDGIALGIIDTEKAV